MVLFRSMTLGLLGACLFLLTGLQPAPLQAAAPVPEVPEAPDASIARDQITVIDLAPHVPANTIAEVIHLQPGEQITMVGDRPVTSELEAGMEVAMVLGAARNLLDLTVRRGERTRRILVVCH